MRKFLVIYIKIKLNVTKTKVRDDVAIDNKTDPDVFANKQERTTVRGDGGVKRTKRETVVDRVSIVLLIANVVGSSLHSLHSLHGAPPSLSKKKRGKKKKKMLKGDPVVR